MLTKFRFGHFQEFFGYEISVWPLSGVLCRRNFGLATFRSFVLTKVRFGHFQEFWDDEIAVWPLKSVLC